MKRIPAPEFRGNIVRRQVLPSLGAEVAIVIAVAVCQALPAYALPKIFSPVAPAKCAALFALPDVDGDKQTLASQKGKPVAVHFFATWCEPCKAEFGKLQQFFKARGDKIAVIAVSVAEVPGRVRSFLKETPVSFPVLLDADRAVTKAWAVEGLPTTVILDKNLRPILAVNGDLDWTHPEVGGEIERALTTVPNSNDAECTKEPTP